MFAGMLAVGLLQNIHLRSTETVPNRFALPVRASRATLGVKG
jgi:rod shape determining protein RodA